MQCYESLSDLVEGTNLDTPASGKRISSKFKPNKPQRDHKLLRILQKLETMKRPSGEFPIHPKMDKMKELIVKHFEQKRFHKDDAVTNGGGEDLSGDPRVMIFASLRSSVEEIVSFLNDNNTLIRAIPYIGQAADKQGKKGYSRKDQLDVCFRFTYAR